MHPERDLDWAACALNQTKCEIKQINEYVRMQIRLCANNYPLCTGRIIIRMKLYNTFVGIKFEFEFELVYGEEMREYLKMWCSTVFRECTIQIDSVTLA